MFCLGVSNNNNNNNNNSSLRPRASGERRKSNSHHHQRKKKKKKALVLLLAVFLLFSLFCAIGFFVGRGGSQRHRREQRQEEEHRYRTKTAALARRFFGAAEMSGNEKCAKILEQIRSGALDVASTTRLDLSNCQLQTFPAEVLRMKNLEFLNLGKNDLDALPESFASSLPNLKILFCLGNKFTKVPEVLGEMEKLFMLSFKANRVREVPERSLSPSLGWLILSDNEIEVLPESLGNCLPMRKLMLAGNKIKELPSFMSKLENLELLRASDNRIEIFPEFLYGLPKLAWLAFAANPCTERAAVNAMERGKRAVKRVVNFEDLGVDEGKKLGSGASGAVYRGEMDGFNVAIKVYNNMGKTSDGRPEDEMAAASLATTTTSDIIEGAEQEQEEETADGGGVIETLAKFTTKDGKRGLVMEYLDPTDWKNLGNPPSFDSVTRDTFDGKFTAREILSVAVDVAKGINQLHKNGVCHGDIYAHNILINRDEDYPSAKLGDFGAAMFFDDIENPQFSQMVRENEARAFGCLLDDMLVNYDGTRGGSDTVTIRENSHASEKQYSGDKILFKQEMKRKQPSTNLDTATSMNDDDKTVQERKEQEQRREEAWKKHDELRREAAKELVTITLPEDGYEKTIASLRQLADDLMDPNRSSRPTNFDVIVKRVRESEKLFYGHEYAKRIERVQSLQRRRYEVDAISIEDNYSYRFKRRERRGDENAKKNANEEGEKKNQLDETK